MSYFTERSRRSRTKSLLQKWRCLADTMVRGALILMLPLVLSAGAEPLITPLEETATPEIASTPDEATIADKKTTCFDFVWDKAHDDPWFLDENGGRVVPEVTRDWLAVYFRSPEMGDVSGEQSENESPEDFAKRYAELFDYRLELPGTETRMFYRLRQGLPFGAFDSFIQQLREEPSVAFVRPVWRIKNQLYAPPEEIEIIWKTAAMPQERQQLLETAGAMEEVVAESTDRQIIRIDPCQRPPWQAAVLLAQDLRVISAVPQLIKLEAPVEVLFDLDTQGALTGTPIPFRLEIRFSEGVEIESATLTNLTLKPTGIFRNLYEVNFDQPLSGLDLNRSPILVTGHLLIYASGETAIPAMPVYFKDSRIPGNETFTRTISTRATPIRIAALVPEAPDAYQLKIASPALPESLPIAESVDDRKTAAFMLVTGLILLSLAIAGWLRLRRRFAPEKVTLPVLERQRLRKSLEVWTERNPSTMTLANCAELGTELKKYLAAATGLPAENIGGSHAFFMRKIENRLTETERKGAGKLLREIDHLLASDNLIEEQVAQLFQQLRILLSQMESKRPVIEN